MAFSYRWLFEDDIAQTADRIAAGANQQLAKHPDFASRSQILSGLWHELQDLGWQALMVNEQAGGIGGSILDLAAMLEGAGRHALPLPLAAAFGIAPLLVDAIGSAGASVASEIASGSAVLTPAIEAVARRAGGKAGAVRCAREGGKLTLEGKLLGVEAVPHATHFLIACNDRYSGPDQAILVTCPVAHPGVSTLVTKRMDGRHAHDLMFDRVVLDQNMLLAAGDAVEAAVERVADLGALLACVEAVAAMGALIEQTIDYLSVRKQFGVPLGSFQALRHYVADMVVAYEGAAALLAHTLGTVARDRDQDHRDAISLLKLRLCEAGGMVARQSIQLHGGMGLTEELLATRLARRILMAALEYGDERFHIDRLLALREVSNA